MLSRRRSEVPQDLQDVDRLLRDRPVLPEDRVQVISSRARARARASLFSTHHPKESLLRSRLSILLMLVFGFVFSSAGVGLALTGVADEDQSASATQYGGPAPVTPPGPGPEGPQGPPPGGPGAVIDEPPTPGGDVDEPPTLEPKGDQPEAPAEETRQLAAEPGGGELPFTGFAAIPLLLLGFALLTGGFVLRR